MITFSVSVTPGVVEEIREALTGEPMRRLLQEAGNDAVAQVRRNIVTEGKASGSFAQLSGYNQGNKPAARLRIQQRKVGILDGTQMERKRDKKTAKQGSQHAGYALQKERDHDKGKIPYGPDEKLRRTGDLSEQLVARVTLDDKTARVEIHAEGTKRGISNDELLSLLAFGTEKMPARNPAVNMMQVEARFAERVRRLLLTA